MTAADLRRVKELFQAAADLPPHERRGWLDAQRLEPPIRAQVDRLLDRLDTELDDLATPVERPAAADAVPTIDRYRLLEEIGEGGFGTVWKAEQLEPVQRLVAVKVIKLGMDTRQIVARFELERQALARMDHPHIARVFDGGTTAGGQPFFAMELVEGVPIDDHCDRERLPVADRMRVMVQVCRGVHHAHQRGLLHRDLKPSNVLVTDVDGAPVPKIIDFGVAKALDDRLDTRSLLTREGTVVGTPEYMSPEQAEAHQAGHDDLDTRSDVYTLGVLVYELLTGELPVAPDRLRGQGPPEILRILREPVAGPSTRVRSTDSAVHVRRCGQPARALSQSLRGELDWITAKALHPDRAARYESASALADDLQRWLDRRPVEAGPLSRRYQLSRFAARHRIGIAVTAVVAFALLAGLVTSWWFAIAAQRQAEVADRRLQDLYIALSDAHAVVADSTRPQFGVGLRMELANELLERAFPDYVEERNRRRGEKFQSNRDWDRAIMAFIRHLVKAEHTDPAVRTAIADALIQSSREIDYSTDPEVLASACAATERALELEGSAASPARPRQMRMLVASIDAHLAAGHQDIAARRLESCLEELRSLLLPDDDPLVAIFEGRRGVLATMRGEHEAALEIYRRTLPAIDEAFPESLYVTRVLAGAVRSTRALDLHDELEDYRRRWFIEISLIGAGLQLVDEILPARRARELRELYARVDAHAPLESVRAAIDPLLHDDAWAGLSECARWYLAEHVRWAAHMTWNQLGRTPDPIPDVFRRAVEELEDGPQDLLVNAVLGYTSALDDLGDLAEVDRVIARTLPRMRTRGPGDVLESRASILTQLAGWLRRRGELERAESFLLAAIRNLRVTEAQRSANTRRALRALAALHEEQGREDDALRVRREVCDVWPGGVSSRDLARTLRHFGRTEDAIEVLDPALEQWPTHRGARAERARLALDRGDRAAAREHLEIASDGLGPRTEPDAYWDGVRRCLAEVWEKLGEHDRAHEVMRLVDEGERAR